MATKKVVVKSTQSEYYTSENAASPGDTVNYVDAAGDQSFYIASDANAKISGTLSDEDSVYLDGNAGDYSIKLGSKAGVFILQSASHKVEVELPKLISGEDSMAHVIFRDGAATVETSKNAKGKQMVEIFGDGDDTSVQSVSKTPTALDTDTLILDESTTSADVFGEPVLVEVAIEPMATEVYEEDGTLEYAVYLSEAAPDSGLTLDYSFSGVAKFGKDYKLSAINDEAVGKATTKGTLTFAAGEDTAYITLTLVDDNTAEDDESIMLTVSGKQVSSPAESEVFIMASDEPAAKALVVGVAAAHEAM